MRVGVFRIRIHVSLEEREYKVVMSIKTNLRIHGHSPFLMEDMWDIICYNRTVFFQSIYFILNLLHVYKKSFKVYLYSQRNQIYLTVIKIFNSIAKHPPLDQ